MHFYSLAEPANLRNHEVRTAEKRGVTVRSLVPYGVKIQCRSGMQEAMLVDLFSLFLLLWSVHSVSPCSLYTEC
jgi:hypothetical protein